MIARAFASPHHRGYDMASNSTKARGKRLGTRLRGNLSAAYGQRGTAVNSLWYVYSPRSESDWILRSDLEWDHFVLAESDPDIASCSYTPQQHRLACEGEQVSVAVDATITHLDGGVEWRRVKFAGAESDENTPAATEFGRCVAAANGAGVKYTLWVEDVIRRNLVLLANWRRAIAWLAAAREHSLAPYQLELGRNLRAEGTLTLGQIESLYGEASFALYAAAVFRELQRGTYVSNLHETQLSRATSISLP